MISNQNDNVLGWKRCYEMVPRDDKLDFDDSEITKNFAR